MQVNKWILFQFSLIVFIFFKNSIHSQSTLILDSIMMGEKFIGSSPDQIQWSADSKSIQFTWNPNQEPGRRKWMIHRSNPSAPTMMSYDMEKKFIPVGEYNEQRTLMLFEKLGDIFLYDLRKDAVTQLTNTFDTETQPRFIKRSRAGNSDDYIIWQSGINLFRMDRSQGSIEQLTSFAKSGSTIQSTALTAQDQWLQDDQLRLMEVIQQRKKKKSWEDAYQDSLQAKRPKRVLFGDKIITDLSIDPTMRFVTAKCYQPASTKSTEVPDYVTLSSYTKMQTARENVGANQDTWFLYIFDIQRDSGYYVKADSLPGIFDKPAFLKEYHKDSIPWNPKYAQAREVIIHAPVWSKGGKAICEVRAMNNKDRWITLIDLERGTLKCLDHQQDTAWIGGPGISSWTESPGTLGWVDEKNIYYQSESGGGYSHLWTMDISQGQKAALTSGTFEVMDVHLSNDQKWFYLKASMISPFQRHIYKIPVQGGKLEQITTEIGDYEWELSPDESMFAFRYSYSNKPWEIYLMANQVQGKMQRCTHSTTPAFENYPWYDPKIIYIPASDGMKIPARAYLPEPGKKNGKAVCFVHGAGYLQNVSQWWSYYYREFMFHNLLRDKGYVVLDLDYRASSGYGRDWRTAIYRHMGGRDLQDYVDASKFLIDSLQIQSDKIGIYGGSYGGFITLMAMFTKPGVFHSGGALRSVGDWAHYNHGYTANILNTPVTDSIAYWRSSPINHVAGFQGNLVILHGMNDLNVHFQDMVRVSQRLIELGKKQWDIAIYPVEDHGFIESTSWRDEYRRLLELFEQMD